MNHNIFLLLGTNIGDRALNLEQAIDGIGKLGEVITISGVYKTEAWGKTDQPEFFNQVIEIQSSFSPQVLLQKILSLEIELGRKRIEKWGPRVIDIDILLYDSEVIQEENLKIPHPGLPYRRFTLLPLNEIASLFIHPVFKKNINTLLKECADVLKVDKV